MAGRIRELIERRSAVAKHYLRDDGLYEAEFHQRPIHFRGPDGAWHDIDLVAEDDASVPGFEAIYRRTPVPVRFAKSVKRPWRVELGPGRWITYRPVGGHPARAEVAGPVVTYRGAWDQADLRYTVLGHGLKEEIILRGPEAPVAYAFEVELRSLRLDPDGQGGYVLLAEDGSQPGRMPPPRAVDAAGVQGPVALRHDSEADLLTLALDPGWVADPARAWPVMVDPTIVLTFTETADLDDGHVMGSGPTYPPPATSVYTTGESFQPERTFHSNNQYYVAVGLVRWDTSSIPEDGVLVSATLRIYVWYVESFNNRSLTAGWYAASNWPIDLTDYTSTAETTAHAGTLLSALNEAADNNLTLINISNINTTGYTGMRLHISGSTPTNHNECNIAAREHLTQAEPRLVVTFTVVAPTATPTSPTGTKVAPGTVTDEITPRLSWTFNGQGGRPQAKYQVQVYDTEDNLVYDTGEVASANAYHDVPLNWLEYGNVYGWRVRVADVYGWGGWSALTYFRCDLTAPTGLVAVPDSDSAQVALSWNVHPGESLAGYNVYRRPAGAGGYTRINLVLVPPAAPAYDDGLAASGQEYEYVVTAVALDGYESPQSSAEAATLTVDGTWIDALRLYMAPATFELQEEFVGSLVASLGRPYPIAFRRQGGRRLLLSGACLGKAEKDELQAILRVPGPHRYVDPLGEAVRFEVGGPPRFVQVRPYDPDNLLYEWSAELVEVG